MDVEEAVNAHRSQPHVSPIPLAECTTLAGLLRCARDRAPGARAIKGEGRASLTYEALLRQVDETAAALASLGLGSEDRVAVVLPNGPEMAACFLGVAAYAACAPLNPAYRRAEFDFYLSDLAAGALILAEADESPAAGAARDRGIPIVRLHADVRAAGRFILAPETAAAGPAKGAVPVGPDDIALMLHTSGTTARPKIVPLTQANLCASAANVAHALALSPSDRCLGIMPLFHIHGLAAGVLATLATGGSIFCTPGFDITRFYDWLLAARPTWYTAVPSMHQSILARAERHAAEIAACPLRFIRSASSALPPATMAGLEAAFGAPVLEAYGMTEASHQVASNPLPPAARKPGSVGPAMGPEAAVMDEAGRLLAPGEMGEIVIRGDNVTGGYAGNPQANAASFTDGWFRTGDQGRIDEDGYIYLTGRIKELINRAGEKIAPREIDEALLAHPAVSQAVAFAVPDARLGEDVAAAVVLRTGPVVSEQELREYCGRSLADFKVPRRIVVMEEMPRGRTGKIQRIGLAEKLGLAGEGAARAPFVAARDDTEARIAAIWEDVLRTVHVGVHDRFLDLGGDSLLAARIALRVNEAFGCDLPVVVLFHAPTAAEMAGVVASRRRAGTDDLASLVAEIEALTDEEAERLLVEEERR